MKNAPRPDVFNENAIVQHFVDHGRSRKEAQLTVSCMRLLIPVVFGKLGEEQLVKIIKDKSLDFGLVPDNWWKHEMPRIVEWAKQLLNPYEIARKKIKKTRKKVTKKF